MKTKNLFYLFFSSCVLFACTKNKDATVAEQIDLQNNSSFRNYVARDIVRKLKLTAYTNNELSSVARSQFMEKLATLKDPDQQAVENVYANFSLGTSKLKTAVLSNLAENLKLLEKIPQLRKLSDSDLEGSLKDNYVKVANEFYNKAKDWVIAHPNTHFNSPISLSVTSQAKRSFINPDAGVDPTDFESIYYSIPTDMSDIDIQDMVNASLGNFRDQVQSNKITTDELLGCGKLVFASIFSSLLDLGNLGKLVEMKGMSKAIEILAKFITRNAGWLGAALLTAEFGICLYHANEN